MKKNDYLLPTSIGILLLGLALILLGGFEVLNQSAVSFGAGLLGVGLVSLFRALKARRDPEYREKTRIESWDERNQYLYTQAWAFAGRIGLVLLAMAIIALSLMGQMQLVRVLDLCFLGLLLLFLFAYLWYKRRY